MSGPAVCYIKYVLVYIGEIQKEMSQSTINVDTEVILSVYEWDRLEVNTTCCSVCFRIMGVCRELVKF